MVSNNRNEQTSNERIAMRLFVMDDGSNSRIAVDNLARFCRKHLTGRCEIEIINVLKDMDTALEYNILVTPTLIVETKPQPLIIFGNLSDSEKVLDVLSFVKERV